MYRSTVLFAILTLTAVHSAGQAGRVKGYSESIARKDRTSDNSARPVSVPKPEKDDGIVRIETDLVTVPVRVNTRKGRPVTDIDRSEFKIFENGEEQEIAYFSNSDEPFTVALLLDMSYSSVFKLPEIQAAAKAFIAQLRPSDRVMVVSFDEKVRVLCEATDNRLALRYAVEAAKVGSGTSLYSAIDAALNEKLRSVKGRKAIVLLSDGVDTTSVTATAKGLLRDIDEIDTLIYPIRYDTFDDVRKIRRKDAQILYDDNDRPYVVEAPLVKGEKEEDYAAAREFLSDLAERSGGRLQRVTSATNLNEAFARIAEELRKTYSLGYYPNSERTPDSRYFIKVRVYRPDLDIRARDNYRPGRRRGSQ
ncbi:MAG: VWA domain-containing protein [Pyrinomonadaceae bacterium]|nr:VWA domain-containing protein [Pyrinomonadaceae bacterium]